MKIFKKNPLYSLFFANLWKNSVLSIVILVFNLIAALLEGISYAFLLFGFSVLTQDVKPDFLFSKFMFDFFENRTQNDVFIFFILSAIVLQMLRSLFCYLGQLMNSFLLLSIQKEAQTRIYNQIFSLSFSSVSAFKTGDLINYATAPPTFIPLVMDHLNRFIISAMMILVYVLCMVFISPLLTSIVFTLFLLTIVLQKIVMKKIASMSSLQSEHMVELSKQTAQHLEGLKIVHIFDRQKEILRKIAFSLNQINSATFKLNKWNHSILPFNEMIGILLVGTALILGLMVLKEGPLPVIPALLTFLTLTYRLGTYIRVGMISGGEIAGKGGPILRLREILSRQDREFVSSSGNRCEGFREDIEIKNISFIYPGSTQYIFKDFSLKIPKGETVALVGPSGGGK
ncbi:MAG: ABC transporter ATP-binding protein, partial [Chlamydiales bacterium]